MGNILLDQRTADSYVRQQHTQFSEQQGCLACVCFMFDLFLRTHKRKEDQTESMSPAAILHRNKKGNGELQDKITETVYNTSWSNQTTPQTTGLKHHYVV